MASSFSASVGAWVQASQGRMQAVLRQSIQDVIEDAQTPVAKGGRMRVDTGFLRNSGQAGIGQMPRGPSVNTGEAPSSEGDVTLTLARLKPGDTLYFGWTANYARTREHKDGFLRMAVQKWQQIVNKNAAELRRRIK
jgi:hypothetical protein